MISILIRIRRAFGLSGSGAVPPKLAAARAKQERERVLRLHGCSRKTAKRIARRGRWPASLTPNAPGKDPEAPGTTLRRTEGTAHVEYTRF